MRGFYFFILCCCTTILSAQSFDALINTQPTLVEQINITQLKENQLFISMPFAQPTVLNPEQKKQLRERVAIKLELVYTQYRTVNSFNQKQLNRNRLIALKKLVPSLFENRFWDFELISQTNGNSRMECDKMFHGFIITFRPNSTSKTLSKEADYLENLVAAFVKQDSLDDDSDNARKKYIIKTHYDMQVGYLHDTIWYKDTVKPVPPPDFFYNQSLYNDSTVLNAFTRNSNWKNLMVVTDVTGSMSPYSAQVFVWLRGQTENKKAQSFVFFNDGDDKPSQKKEPLNTKGVYHTKNKDLNSVINVAAKCMRNGSGGGESLENDVEAIIEGLKHYKETEEIILIADNHEMMRDYDFINKVKKPVHIILCGAKNRVNLQYLDFARQTKGSIHTIHSDVTNLHLIKENQHFFIDEKEYMYKNGRFHSIYSTREKYR